LDAGLPDGYLPLAVMESRAGRFEKAEELYLKAVTLDPTSTEALGGLARVLVAVGRVMEAFELKKRSHELEPFVPINNRNYALGVWLAGEADAALDIFKAINGVDLSTSTNIALIHAGAGRYHDAADGLLTAPSGMFATDTLKEAVRLLRAAPASAPENPVPLGALDFVYLFVGAPERVLEYYERNVEAGWMVNAQTELLWLPAYGPARKTERFKSLMRKAGMVEYWRAKGWPEFCHPTTGDDFECN
jgi:tetratricopeptide (TPR) repeat protein